MMRRVLALTRKEVHQLLRDRSNLMLGGVLPIILILIFGYGLSFDVRDAPVAVAAIPLPRPRPGETFGKSAKVE